MSIARQHVERDREPLEPEEERHQVRRLHEERHSGARRREQREVLGDVLVAHPLAVGDQHRDGARARDQHLGERRPAVAEERVVRRSWSRPGSSRRRATAKTNAATKPAKPVNAATARARPGRHEHRDSSSRPAAAEQRERRREREPVDVRLVDHVRTASTASSTDRDAPCVILRLPCRRTRGPLIEVRPRREAEQAERRAARRRELAEPQVERRVA